MINRSTLTLYYSSQKFNNDFHIICYNISIEADVSDIVAKLEMAGDHMGGLMIIDGQLGARK